MYAVQQWMINFIYITIPVLLILAYLVFRGTQFVLARVAYFGSMGEENGLINISAIGDEVNTAARLASKAATGEIIISEAALSQTEVDASKLESRTLELKGISEPMTVRVMRG